MKWTFREFKHPRFVGPSWENWKATLSIKSEGTQSNFTHYMIGVLDHLDLTTQSLYETYRDHRIKGLTDPMFNMILPNQIASYQKHLMEVGRENPRTKKIKKLKSGTVNNYPKAINSFFVSNGIDTFSMIGNKIKSVTEEIPMIPKEDLRLVLNLTGSTRQKAIIHLAKDSGARRSDIVNFKIDDLRSFLEGDQEYYTWEFKPKKSEHSSLYANPCIGRESKEWLKLWMIERDRINDEREVMGLAPTTWVFCLVENYQGRQVGDQLTGDNVSHLFKLLVKKAKLKNQKISFHSLRGYHQTMLQAGNVPLTWINRMTGRRGTGTQGIYSKPDEKQLIEVYKKGYSKLALTEHAEVERIDNLEAENEQLKKRVDFLTNQVQTYLAVTRGVATSVEVENELEIEMTPSKRSEFIMHELDREGIEYTIEDQRVKPKP